MDYYAPLIYSQLPQKEVLKLSLTKNPHLQVSLGLFEPRLSAKSRKAFKEIEHVEGILRSLNNLMDSIHFVVGALKAINTAGTQQPIRKDYERRMQELDGLCKERRGNADRALQALNRQLDYLTKRHAIREAEAIKILTILASLYLPLSLSATMLSIQFPFKKIGHTKTSSEGRGLARNKLAVRLSWRIHWGSPPALYSSSLPLDSDFGSKSEGLGKFPKNFSGSFSIFYYERRWRFGGRGGRIFEYIQVLTAWWIGAALCVTLLVTFLVGMLDTAQAAWDTARWMFAAYEAISLAFPPVLWRYVRLPVLQEASGSIDFVLSSD